MPHRHRLQSQLADELASYIETEVSLGDEPVLPQTDLVMTGLVDSLGVVKIVGWLEDRTGLIVDPADVVIEHFGSIAAMLAYVAGRNDVEPR